MNHPPDHPLPTKTHLPGSFNANRRVLLLFLFTATVLALVILLLQRTVFEAAAGDPAGSPDATIQINTAANASPFNQQVLGTNAPAWLNPNRLADTSFINRTTATGTPLIRMPGGSWSNYYDWLACERFGQGIDPEATCYWLWAARPADFATFLRSTGAEGMYTINQNGTTQEAAALVAYFNGATTDDRVIGVDVRGRDWGRVSDWAQLRHDHGNPDPVPVRYWEIGNETYGGKPGLGTDCLPWGWEDVWTCDGTEYVNGIGSGVNRKEGFLEFQEAMKAVDPTIMVGAVGIPFQAGWTNWGNEVIAAAGEEMDFYIIHQYAYFDPPAAITDVLAQPQGIWAAIMADVEASFDQYAGGRQVPIAVTEYNLFATQDRDYGDWMSRAVNGLFLADTIGQMAQHGFDLANQWDLAHGEGNDTVGYGLMQADSYFRGPQYYVYPLWSRFGTQMLPVTSSLPADTDLSVYAGRVNDFVYSLMAINKTGNPIAASITLDGINGVSAATADVMAAGSLESYSVTFNGVSDPADDLSDAPPTNLNNPGNPLAYTFAPYSVTLLRIHTQPQNLPYQHYLAPILSNP